MHKVNILKGAFLPTERFATRPLSATSVRPGILSNDKNEPQDPSKQSTDSITQAKRDEGRTPAQQHARATGHPVNESSGTPSQAPSQPGKSSPGLGLKHAEQDKKPGEEAVNPAVQKG